MPDGAPLQLLGVGDLPAREFPALPQVRVGRRVLVTPRARGGGTMRYGSVCSGLEAASVAWGPLGWECAFVSEIERFPNANALLISGL